MTKLSKLMMCGVATCHRGLGVGGAVLDNVITVTSREYFHLVVRYPADQQLILVMLMARGLTSAGSACANHVGFLLALAKSRCYVAEDALMPYDSLATD